jgi:hypothetical protein
VVLQDSSAFFFFCKGSLWGTLVFFLCLQCVPFIRRLFKMSSLLIPLYSDLCFTSVVSVNVFKSCTLASYSVGFCTLELRRKCFQKTFPLFEEMFSRRVGIDTA